jgi:hypothetical protein
MPIKIENLYDSATTALQKGLRKANILDAWLTFYTKNESTTMCTARIKDWEDTAQRQIVIDLIYNEVGVDCSNISFKRLLLEGHKDDAGKLEWSLVPWDAMEGCVRVLMEGAKKYAPDNWKRVPDASKRYKDALMRHVLAYCKGEKVDEEFGASHLDHAMCNLLFLKWLDIHGSEDKK